MTAKEFFELGVQCRASGQSTLAINHYKSAIELYLKDGKSFDAARAYA